MDDKFMRPSEFLELHPEIKRVWTIGDIGNLLRMKIISGRRIRRGCEVSERELLTLFDGVKSYSI
jgi:hypothetical protein